MTLDRDAFGDFYAEVNGGHRPFAWQCRLLDHLLDEGRWPDQVAAPTGAGKTSAIDVHVFATALTNPVQSGGRDWPRLPRRLALVVDRRVLVDDQHERARALAVHLAAALASPEPPAMSAEVARHLVAMRWPAERLREAIEPEDPRAWPLVVARLRGGVVPARWWRDELTACAIVCATPDMWGSRVLFRGYGTTARAAPREAGVLAFDAAVMVDEAHLARQLLTTARRVSELAKIGEQPLDGVPPLQVVETSATPPGSSSAAVTVEESDLVSLDGRTSALAARLRRPKPIRLLRSEHWPGAGARSIKLAADIAEAVACLRAGLRSSDEDRLAHTVACFVNTVPMATRVADRLRLDGLRVVLVCGQTRQADLDRLRRERPGVFTPNGNPEVDVVVSTQSLEVGVDLDLAGVVTELASGSALAQRAGRVNRRGLRETAPVFVIGPATKAARGTEPSGPYAGPELDEALDWILRREADPLGMAPWGLREDPPPAAHPRRVLYQRPELADVWHWARTSDDLAAEPELDLWLSDSFDVDTSVGVVVRDLLPEEVSEAIELIRRLPPREHEVYPVPRRTAVVALSGDRLGTMLRVRGEDVSIIRRNDRGSPVDIRPGDVVVVDSESELFTPAGDGGVSPQVVSPEMTGRERSSDVLATRGGPIREGEVVLRLDLRADRPVGGISCGSIASAVEGLVAALVDIDAEVREARRVTSAAEKARRAAVTDFLTALLDTPQGVEPGSLAMVEAALRLLAAPTKHSDLLVDADADDVPYRVLLVDRRRVASDDEVRQVLSPRGGVVSLEQHQSAVAHRAAVLAEHLGLRPALVDAVRDAGAHHDDGKADPRFQARLGADEGLHLAKSEPRSTLTQIRERERRAGLPPGWRHEQLSVLAWWRARTGDPSGDSVQGDPGGGPDPQLVARLVGTSHGHGRSSFTHAASGLLPANHEDLLAVDAAVELFELGGWDDLMERTEKRYGVWGCAYLEAVLRAADGQVSGEGS